MAATEHSGEMQGCYFWTQKIPQGMRETKKKKTEDPKTRSRSSVRF